MGDMSEQGHGGRRHGGGSVRAGMQRWGLWWRWGTVGDAGKGQEKWKEGWGQGIRMGDRVGDRVLGGDAGQVTDLDVVVGVPVGVEDDDGVGGGQVDAEAPGPRRQQEAELLRPRRCPPGVSGGGRSSQTRDLPTPPGAAHPSISMGGLAPPKPRTPQFPSAAPPKPRTPPNPPALTPGISRGGRPP